MTVWFNFGTFWGVVFSDPVPRVFYAALWPFLLAAAILALDRPRLRPGVMLASGAGIYVHSISALSFSGMLFTAFLLIPVPGGVRRASHPANAALGLALFFIPVFLFLWPALGQEHAFTSEELETFRELFALRFEEDYGGLLTRLAAHVRFDSDTLPLLCGGVAGYVVTVCRGGERARKLARMYPGFLLGTAFVLLFSRVEPWIASTTGRLAMGEEFVRCVRFMAPFSWIMIVSAAACFWPRLGRAARGIVVAGTFAAVALLSQDRWQMAAFYTISQQTGLELPMQDKARQTLCRSSSYRHALDAVRRLVPPGAPVCDTSGNMAVRYVALRPLTWTFKDGSSNIYNKDVQGARAWLASRELAARKPSGYIDAWLASDADWLLCDRPRDKALVERHGEIVWENQDWFIAIRR